MIMSFTKHITSWTSILISGVVIILFLIFVESIETRKPKYESSWKHGQWISPQESAANSYFRSNLQITSSVHKAILKIAAKDSVIVYLNGKKVSKKDYKSTYLYDVFDVSDLVSRGKNTLAIANKLSSYPPIPELRYELIILDDLGRSFNFGSSVNTKYKTSWVTLAEQKIPWFDPAYNDTAWDNVILTPGPDVSGRFSVSPNWLLSLPVASFKKVDAPSDWKLSTMFSLKDIVDEKNIDSLWFGVSSNATYELFIDEESFGVFPIQVNQVTLRQILDVDLHSINNLRLEFNSAGQPLKLAGGLYYQEGGQLHHVPFTDKWNAVESERFTVSSFVEGENTSRLIKVVDDFSREIISYRLASPINNLSLFNISQSIYFFVYLLLIFSVVKLAAYYDVDDELLRKSVFMSNLFVASSIIFMFILAQDIRMDGRELFSSRSYLCLVLIWFLSIVAMLFETLSAEVGLRQKGQVDVA